MYAQIVADHQLLAQLIDQVAQVCGRSEARPTCSSCTPEVSSECEEAIRHEAENLLHLILEHFAREDALMMQLPQSAATRDHCEVHRQAHSEFAVRFNKTLALSQYRDAAERIKAVDSLLHDWTRFHALVFDKELEQMCAACSQGPASG